MRQSALANRESRLDGRLAPKPLGSPAAMGKKLPEVDAYIERAAPFAQPILKHLRGLVHKAVPDVEEAIKWGMPYFTLKGDPLCAMAGFKAHCAFGFWKAPLITTATCSQEETSRACSI